MNIKIYSREKLSTTLKKIFQKQLQLNFPEYECFKIGFEYQLKIKYAIVAHRNNEVAGFVYITYKTFYFNNRKIKVGAIGMSIHPKYQGKGIGTKLTKKAIEVIKKDKADLAMATTINPIVSHMIQKLGFTKLQRKISFLDIDKNKIVIEKFEVYMKDFDNKLVKQIESKKTVLYTGIGSV